MLNSVLSFVRGNRPLTAILGFFANLELPEVPPGLVNNVFDAIVTTED